jgi:hypothetical protein
MNIRKVGAIVLVFGCVVYMLNPSAGVFEILPDNIPIVGNIDEGLAMYLMLCGLSYLRTGRFPILRRFTKS